MISVALCTYNGEKFIHYQLDSILNQSMPVDEIVIFDDCSTDATVRIIGDYVKKFPDIVRLHINKVNVGFRKNFEEALRACNGDYIFFSDQDDIWQKEKVEKTVSFLDSSGKWGVFTNGDLIDEEGNNLSMSLFDSLKMKDYFSQSAYFPSLFAMLCLNDNFVTGATMAITNDAKKVVLPFYTSTNIFHDHYIALKLAAINQFSCINEPLISYRVHTNQQIGVGKEKYERLCLYNIYNATKMEDEDAVVDLCKYLIFRRKLTLYHIRVCKLSSYERGLIRKEYRELLQPLITNLCLKNKINVLIRYISIEAQIAIRSFLGV